MEQDIKGHIFVIGTTLEWFADIDFSEYVESKIRLRNRCLELNQQTGITGIKVTYVILGGVNDGQSGHEDMVHPSNIASAIEWALSFPTRVAMIQLDGIK